MTKNEFENKWVLREKILQWAESKEVLLRWKLLRIKGSPSEIASPGVLPFYVALKSYSHKFTFILQFFCFNFWAQKNLGQNLKFFWFIASQFWIPNWDFSFSELYWPIRTLSLFPECTNPDHVVLPNSIFPNVFPPAVWIFTKSPLSGPQETPFGSGNPSG